MGTNKSRITRKVKGSNNIKPYYLLVLAFAFLLFSNSLVNDYNLDDELVTINHRLTSKGIGAIPEIFTSPYYEDSQGYAYEYRPVTLATFAIEHSIFGDKPAVSHFINLLIYIACCLLLFKLLQVLFERTAPVLSLAITLLFISHCTHSEVVCSIKNRDEILALFFALLSMLSALKYINQEKWHWLLGIGFMFTLGLLNKTTILPFAIIIPLSIMIFRNCGFIKILLISLTLLGPSYLLLNMGNGFARIQVILAMFLVIVLLYVAKNRLQLSVAFRALLAKISDNEIYSTNTVNHASFSSIPFPVKELFKPSNVLTILILLVFYGTVLHLQITFWLILPLTILFFLSWKGSESIRWLAIVSIIFCLTYNCFYVAYEPTYFKYYANFTITFLGLIILYGSRTLLIPALLGIIGTSAFFPGYTEFLTYILPTFAFLFLATFKYSRILLLVLLALTLFGNKSTETSISGFEYASILSGIITLFFLQFNKKHIVSWSWSFVLLSIVSFLSLRYNYNHNIINSGYAVVFNATNEFNPQIIKKQDRPLQYTEVCVQQNNPLTTRLGTSMEILFHYLKKTILPYPLAYYYGYRFIKPMNITDTIPMISLVIHLALFFIALYLMNKDPLITFGLFTYLFSIAVFSNYVQYIPGMVADRYLLVPSLGWSIVLVGVIWKFSGIADNAKHINWKSIKPVAKYSFLSILLLYSALTFSRNTYWKDDLTLFRHDIEYVNESAQAHNLIALHLMIHATKESNIEKQNALAQEALMHFKKALEIYPPFFNVAYDIGRVTSMLNMPDSAIQSFEYALTLDSTLPDIYMRLGDLYFSKNAIERANMYLAHYIQLVPNDYAGYSKLSYNYYLLKQYDQSVEINRNAISKIPGLAAPYINIAQIFLETNQRDSARIYLLKAKELSPNDVGLATKINQLGF